MLFLRSHTIRHKQRRGSVIVLVVAVLALLAVIGTVYIVSSRAERSSATASGVAVNLNLAQKAVEQMFLSQAASAMIDATGTMGGYANTGLLGVHGARRWDIGEINRALNADPGNVNFFPPNLPTAHIIGQSDHNPSHKDQAWLVSSLYVPNGGENYVNPDGSFNRYNQMSLLTSAAFNPSTGTYNLPFYKAAPLASTNWNDLKVNSMNFFEVVAPNLSSVQVPLPQGGNTSAGPDAFIQLLPFSESSGIRYRFGIRIIDTSRMANLNVGMTYDSANPSATQAFGTYFNGYNLSAPALYGNGNGMGFVAGADMPTALQLQGAFGNPDNPGRMGSWTPAGAAVNFALPAGPLDYYWQQAAFRFESPVIGPIPMGITPFDLSDELELRAYGALGTTYMARAALASPNARVWPNILGNRDPNTQGLQMNLRRQNYTSYSASRDLRPVADPTDPFSLTPPNGAWNAASTVPPDTSRPYYVWPPFPAKVSAAPEIMGYARATGTAGEDLAMAVTNIATAMLMSGYSAQEARAFAASYLTYRWNSWQEVREETHKNQPVKVFSLPLGPSFLDRAGICLRPFNAADAMNFGNNVTDLRSERDDKVYLGYAGQPFINELAVTMVPDGTGGTVIQDCAIELYNPYNVAISLNDFCLNVGGTNLFQDKNWWIPPHGYFVLSREAAGLGQTITNADAQKQVEPSFDLNPGKVYLMRKYVDRAGAVQYGAVDQFDATTLTTPPQTPPTAPETHFVARDNDELVEPALVLPGDPGYAQYVIDLNKFFNHPGRWVAAVHATTFETTSHKHSGTAPDRMSLGEKNHNTGAIAHAVPLYDRMLEQFEQGNFNFDSRNPLRNVADFNRVMRISHEIDTAAAAPGLTGTVTDDSGALSAQLYARITTPGVDVTNCPMPWEAGVHFDFRAVPAIYATSGRPGSVGGGQGSDLRAVRLLDLITFTDRVSDYSINIGDNDPLNRGVSKVRIPGQINVNTASPEVLTTIPQLNARPAYIGTIMAYRWRTSTLDPRIPAVLRPAVPVNFSAAFPGYGIRSMAELMAAFEEHDRLNPPPVPNLFPNLDTRDQLWASLYNYLTVRSDTFVMYAYIEAVRQNPRYNGAFNNSTDWYLPTSGAGSGVSDDPNNTTLPLQRVGRRRWVAVVDRSTANANRVISNGMQMVPNPFYTDPRIVASKDLPQ